MMLNSALPSNFFDRHTFSFTMHLSPEGPISISKFWTKEVDNMKKINVTLCSNEKTLFLKVSMVSCIKNIPVKNSFSLKILQ